MKKDSRVIPILILILCMGLLVALILVRGNQNQEKTTYSATDFAMGTAISMTIYGEHAEQMADQIIEAVNVLDTSVLSWRSEASEVWKLNHNYTVGEEYPISQELAEYLVLSEQIADMSDGVLDITIRPLANVWGIEDGNTEIPDEENIHQALNFIDYKSIQVTEQSTTDSGADIRTYTVLIDKEGISIDFGAIGKGIACDRIAELLQEQQCSASVAVGGSIVVVGEKPDGSSWMVGIRNPRDTENAVMGVIKIDTSNGESKFISTSGDYEKYFMEDGRRYHHILNPHTGYPADTGTISATVICDSGALSDALSTVCVLVGREHAFEILNMLGAEGILIDENLQVYVTDGIRSSFTIRDEDYQIGNMD